jgi:hypothetical protein
VPIIAPPDPDRPTAKGTASVVFNTRFVPDNGLTGLGPSPITNQSGTGATVEQPVVSGRQKIGDRGVNVQLAPALLRIGAVDCGQDSADVDVLLAAPPVPIDYSCRERFGPFRINFDRFEDEPGQVEAIQPVDSITSFRLKPARTDRGGGCRRSRHYRDSWVQ